MSSLPWAKSIFHLDERDLPSQLQTKQPVKECPDKKYDPSGTSIQKSSIEEPVKCFNLLLNGFFELRI